MINKRNLIIISIGILVSEIGWEFLKFIGKRVIKGREKKDEKDHVEVLMFTHDGKYCRDHVKTKTRCTNRKSTCPVGNVGRLEWYLRNAIKTLDVCMYIMTSEDIIKAIIRASQKGALVRIIVDSEMIMHPSFNQQILALRRAGIAIRSNLVYQPSLMHHKFALIDGKFIIFGSTNWTMLAFYGNNDSIVVTNNEECLKTCTTAFEKMWLDFKE